MTFLADRVRVTTATTGIGPVTLGAAVSHPDKGSFQTFAEAGVPDGAQVSYLITEGLAWETGKDVYAAAGPTLARTNVKASSNGGAAIDLQGTAEVFITALAEDLQSRALTPSALSLTSHDYNPPGLEAAGELRLSLGVNGITLMTGIAGGYDGRELVLTNLSTEHPIVLTDENDKSWDRDNIIAEQSQPANRFSFGAHGSISINLQETLTIRYDQTSSRWKLLARADLTTRREVGVRNRVINGRMQIWQRGTSFTDPGVASGGSYTADRWRVNFLPSEGGAGTVSRVALPATESETIDGNPAYAMQLDITTSPSTNGPTFQQRIAGVGNYAGRMITVSLWAKIVNDPLAEGLNIALRLQQRFGAGGGASSPVQTESFYYDRGLNSSGWVRYSWMFNVPSIGGKTIGTDGNDALEIMGSLRRRAQNIQLTSVQIEDGHQPTPIEVLDEQTVLEQCIYYYQRVGAMSGATMGNPDNILVMAPFEVMRKSNPAVTVLSETIFKTLDGNHVSTGLAIVSSNMMPDGISMFMIATSWNPVLNINIRPGVSWATTPWLELDAEL